jgi:hypothetical protein
MSAADPRQRGLVACPQRHDVHYEPPEFARHDDGPQLVHSATEVKSIYLEQWSVERLRNLHDDAPAHRPHSNLEITLDLNLGLDGGWLAPRHLPKLGEILVEFQGQPCREHDIRAHHACLRGQPQDDRVASTTL